MESNTKNDLLLGLVILCAFIILSTVMCRACYISGQRSVSVDKTEVSVMEDYIMDVIMETDYYDILLEDEWLNSIAEMFGDDDPYYLLQFIVSYTEMYTADETRRSAD